jgi:hypothetical protein
MEEKLSNALWNKSPTFSLGAKEENELEIGTLFVVPTPSETVHSGVVHVGGAGGTCM